MAQDQVEWYIYIWCLCNCLSGLSPCLLHSTYQQIPFSLVWKKGVGKKQITELGCEIYFCKGHILRSTAGAALISDKKRLGKFSRCDDHDRSISLSRTLKFSLSFNSPWTPTQILVSISFRNQHLFLSLQVNN
jgi:hypothetical protein